MNFLWAPRLFISPPPHVTENAVSWWRAPPPCWNGEGRPPGCGVNIRCWRDIKTYLSTKSKSWVQAAGVPLPPLIQTLWERSRASQTSIIYFRESFWWSSAAEFQFLKTCSLNSATLRTVLFQDSSFWDSNWQLSTSISRLFVCSDSKTFHPF